MTFLKKKSLLMSMIIFSLIFFISCNQKKGTLESILDEYIAFHDLNGSKHYVNIGIGKWSDSTSIMTISFAYIGVDKLALPEETYKSSYRGITLYFDQNIKLSSLSHSLKFEKIITKQEKMELEAYNEYFNDIQIVYCSKSDCIVHLLDNIKEANIFEKKFEEKGLICPNSFKCSVMK